MHLSLGRPLSNLATRMNPNGVREERSGELPAGFMHFQRAGESRSRIFVGGKFLIPNRERYLKAMDPIDSILSTKGA